MHRFLLVHLHPGRLTAGSYKSPIWNGKSPNVHDYIPCYVIFRGVPSLKLTAKAPENDGVSKFEISISR